MPSPIRNLKEANYYISPEKLLSAIGWEYLRTSPISLEDGGNDLISKQRGFQLINPTDKWFPGMFRYKLRLLVLISSRKGKRRKL